MDVAKKYEGKTIQELGALFYELGNRQLVPELRKQFVPALEQFAAIQQQDEDVESMIVVADLQEKIFVFATGDGSDLEGKDSDCVFYTAKSEAFNDCMELFDYIRFGNHPEGYIGLDRGVCDWICDALPEDAIGDMQVEIFYNSFYGEAEADPIYEG